MMNETETAQALILEISEVARLSHCKKVLAARVGVGEKARISSDYLLQHFISQAQGTVAEGARLEIGYRHQADDPRAGDVVLEDVELVC